MPFEISFTQAAADHVRAYRKFDQRIILDGIDQQLRHEPTEVTRNRKHLGESKLSEWELRVQDFRVFYDVVEQDERQIVKINAVGHKVHDKLFIGDREVEL